MAEVVGPAGAPLLSVRGLEVAYGPVVAVRGVSLDVHPGEIVALLGPNGAGKTSTLRGITGLVPPAAGTVTFAGDRIDRLAPDQVVARGLAHVPEGRRVFPGLSVLDNLMLGAWGVRSRTASEQRQLVYELFPLLAERGAQLAGSLSGGEQQMLAIGRALMSAPRLLLIDELSLGLAPIVVDWLLAHLVELNREGLSLLLIEQFVHRALEVAARVYVLAKGRVQLAGSAQSIAGAAAVETAYLSGGQ